MLLIFPCRCSSCYIFKFSVKISFALVCQTLVVVTYLTSCNGVPAYNISAVSGDPIQNPENVALVAGNEKLFNCAGGLPFRWYRYRLSNPNLDEVIFMGSQMADNVDERFRIYTSPQNYPYKQLDLHIANVDASLAGTYRCFRGQDSHCAELIVLESEPKCRIHREGFGKTVQFICSVNVTANGHPELVCSHDNQYSVTYYYASCERSNGIVTCTLQVPAAKQTEYSCSVQISARPKTNYRICSHTYNMPSYKYTWEPSSVVSLEDPCNPFHSPIYLGLFIGVPVIISVIVLFACLCRRRYRKDQKDRRLLVKSSTSSAESGSCSIPDYTEPESNGFLPPDYNVVCNESENTEEGSPPGYDDVQHEAPA